MKIVACIHNNSLGKVIAVASDEEAKDAIRREAEATLGHPLLDEQVDDLNDRLEVIDESDVDNLWSWSMGIVE
jgi:predicted house-cleaning noncanonical NTP pyrophosphatase (MazG superfamily)